MSETTAGKASNDPQKSRFTSGREVSLGLGSLLLIAMIVIIFGGGGSSSLKSEMQSLRGEITELKKTIETQTTEIRQLRDLLPSAGKKDESK